jgi:hypothetical protein
MRRITDEHDAPKRRAAKYGGEARAEAFQLAAHFVAYVRVVEVAEAVDPVTLWTKAEETSGAVIIRDPSEPEGSSWCLPCRTARCLRGSRSGRSRETRWRCRSLVFIRCEQTRARHVFQYSPEITTDMLRSRMLMSPQRLQLLTYQLPSTRRSSSV